MKTRNDLVNAALTVLLVLAAGQTAEAEDFDTVDEHVDSFLASLAARDIVIVDDVDEIPEEWFLALATLLADRCADSFGLPGVPSARPNPVLDAETELREINYARPTYEPQRNEYF